MLIDLMSAVTKGVMVPVLPVTFLLVRYWKREPAGVIPRWYSTFVQYDTPPPHVLPQQDPKALARMDAELQAHLATEDPGGEEITDALLADLFHDPQYDAPHPCLAVPSIK